MKLLFDENLSPRLPGLLRGEFPESAHVREIALRGAPDRRIWDYARDQGFAIVSKDNDFRQLSFLHGAPPKTLWLSIGNVGTSGVAGLLRKEQAQIDAFGIDADSSLLVLAIDE